MEKGETATVKTTKKFPIKILVWGAIGWRGKSKLYFIPQSERLTSQGYQNILQHSLLPAINSLSFKPTLFMQDGAPCHTAASSVKWLESNKVDLLPNWPPQSPDLNPLENIWGLIKNRIDLSNISSQDLFQKVEETWIR